MRSRLPLLAAAGFFAVIAFAWWRWSREHEPLLQASPPSEGLSAGESTAPAAMHRNPPAEPSKPIGVAPMDEVVSEASEAHGDLEHVPAPTGDLHLYAERPMSPVPHRVIRAWGASDDPSHLGLVGAYVIVEPGLSDAKLIELCRDIRAYHKDANALSVRILDSEEAATYDRHIDGGLFKNQHQVATVTRDPKFGEDSIHVRGERVEP